MIKEATSETRPNIDETDGRTDLQTEATVPPLTASGESEPTTAEERPGDAESFAQSDEHTEEAGRRTVPDPKEAPIPAEIEFELNRGAEDGVDMRQFDGYTALQLHEARLAAQARREDALAVFAREDYEDKNGKGNHLSYLQMRLIRKGAEEELDLERFAHPDYGPNEMWEIMEGLRDGVDVRHFASPAYSAPQMREIRLGLLEGLETKRYEKPELSPRAMRDIRESLRPLDWRSRWKMAARILRGPTAKRKRAVKY